jgi:membrane-bound ClpP family serine protease
MLTGISLTLVILGLALIIVEIFLIPSVGVVGLMGFFVMLFGIFRMADNFAQGVIYFLITLLATGLIIYIGYKTGHIARLWNRLSLRDKQKNEDGYVAPNLEYQNYLGKRGVALTLLRPAGSALIDGQRVDVVSDGSFIPKDSPIEVIAVEGTRVIVNRIDTH